MLAPEGYPLIFGSAVLAIVVSVIGVLLVPYGILLVLVGVLTFVFTVWFFRDPARTPPSKASGLMLAPADGKIIEIVEEEDPIYLRGPVRRLSIFLSPLNVHVNRIPVDGKVEYERYVPGEYLVAWHPKASEKNERSEIGVMHPSGVPILFKQIAGAVARRIVYYPRVGDSVQAGDRFGIVKFGSRMDVIVPPYITFSVEPGQRVVAGETVLGSIEARKS